MSAEWKNQGRFAILTTLLLLNVFSSCKKDEAPTLTTTEVTDITTTSAVSGGNISFDGGSMVFERGVCWSTNTNPTIQNSKTSDGEGKGSFISSITNLEGATKYYLRAYASNSVGVGYGNELSFTTDTPYIIFPIITYNPNLTYGSVTDIEGNVYKTIQIGTQTWMAENLMTSKYNDNTNITLVTDSATWSNLTTEGFCWYGNDKQTYGEIYGVLYNFYAVNTGKLCPTGWHVPSNTDWAALIDYLGGSYSAALDLKESGLYHWIDINTGTNNSGFTALPGGSRYMWGQFDGIGLYSVWWSSVISPEYPSLAYYMSIEYNSIADAGSTCNFNFGVSVRCIKD